MTHTAPMFDVVFLRLDDPDKIRQWRTEDLARMLGVGLDEAFSMGLGQPSVLRRGVSQDEANRLERAVEDVGGAVKVRPAAQPRSVAGLVPVPMAAAAPVKRMYVPPAEAAGGASMEGPTSFFGGLPKAALIPVRGSGLVWVLGIAGAAMLGTVMMAVTACMWPVALALGTMVMLVTVALMARYFSACLVSARNGWKAPEHSLLEVDAGDALRQGAAVLVWFLVACAPLFAAVHGATRYMESGSASMWIGLIAAASVLPMVLWPAALAQANVEGSMMGLFDPMGMIRLIGRAPLSYLAVLVVPVMVSMSPSVVMALMAVTAPLLALLVGAAGMLVSIYAFGLSGALMGLLIQTSGEGSAARGVMGLLVGAVLVGGVAALAVSMLPL